MQLFDKSLVDPEKLRPKDHDEPVFSFLQASGKPCSAEIRDLLEQWFRDYPKEEQNELRQRFVTSKSDIQSPAFELALHAVFKRLGAVVAIHPEVPGDTNRRPDFLIRLPTGFEFYLEAVLARGQSDEERNREAVVNSLYAVINRRLDSPEYFWSVTLFAQGAAAPSGRQMVRAISEYMSGLNRADVGANLKVHGFETPEKLLWEDAGWRVEFLPIPKKIEAIGRPDHRPLGSFPMPKAVCCSDHVDIREAIKFKLKHHSELDRPYVIAVNAMNWSADKNDFISGIYGTDQVTVKTYEDGTHTMEDTRAMDGIWLSAEGTRHERLISVIGSLSLQPWTVASSTQLWTSNRGGGR